MSDRSHLIATLILFVLFAAYGLEALTIPLFPGQEDEPFKPRTMPLALAIVGLLLTVIRAIQLTVAQAAESGPLLGALNWQPAIKLCFAMLAYGFMMVPAGFIVATTLFLVASFLVLGERRRSVLLFLPFAFSLVFFLVMTEGLGLYLSSGNWLGS